MGRQSCLELIPRNYAREVFGRSEARVVSLAAKGTFDDAALQQTEGDSTGVMRR